MTIGPSVSNQVWTQYRPGMQATIWKQPGIISRTYLFWHNTRRVGAHEHYMHLCAQQGSPSKLNVCFTTEYANVKRTLDSNLTVPGFWQDKKWDQSSWRIRCGAGIKARVQLGTKTTRANGYETKYDTKVLKLCMKLAGKMYIYIYMYMHPPSFNRQGSTKLC